MHKYIQQYFFFKQIVFLLLFDFSLYFITYYNKAYHAFHSVSCLFISCISV